MGFVNLDRLKSVLLVIAITGLLGGLVLHFSGRSEQADMVWTAGVLPILAALIVESIRDLRRGEVGLDIVAALSMSAAVT